MKHDAYETLVINRNRHGLDYSRNTLSVHYCTTILKVLHTNAKMFLMASLG